MYPLFKQEATKKAGHLAIKYVNCYVRVNAIIDFRGDQIFVYFIRFLIHEALHAWCLIFAAPGF